jgi:hypothetical protein
MNPREFLSLAQSLIEKWPESPALYRTVIGRSYYAAFNVLAAITSEANIQLEKSGDSHIEVMNIVADSEDRYLKQACDSLARQKLVRRHADYDMKNKDVETLRKASMAIVFAQQTIGFVDQARSNPDSWRVAKEKIVACAEARGKTCKSSPGIAAR